MLRATSKRIISIEKFLKKRAVKPYSKIINQIWEKKGFNVVGIDISKSSDIADFIIICSGSSTKHCQSIAEELEKSAKTSGLSHAIEGYGKGDWVLVDIGNIIIHIFTEETREIYDLEGLWYGSPCYHIQEVAKNDQ
ncbi:MAG: ribosome silencing factor [Proteobacteria bacterium]|nr:ribosome silencing factor [Pseudomonadota bacterium]